ncbi:hypothetical protein [Oleiagrimonas soli]|nr:hypothetical protein [Oleiagrimonas soli]MBB6184548.1 hypothetical protein [Oleiagrimonas soli]
MKTRQYALWLGLLMAATWTLSSGCSAQPNPSDTAVQAHAVTGKVPDESAIKALVDDANVGAVAPDADDADDAISDRILDGFQAAPSGLQIEDGPSIAWGFKFQQGNQQSAVVYDASGHVLLAAIVNDIVRVDDGIGPAVTSQEAYGKRVKDAGVDPQVMVFAASRDALDRGYPLFRRWLQADLLGFNIDCAKKAAACAFAEKLSVPVQAFVAGPSGKGPAKVATPSGAAAAVPLGRFVQ